MSPFFSKFVWYERRRQTELICEMVRQRRDQLEQEGNLHVISTWLVLSSIEDSIQENLYYSPLKVVTAYSHVSVMTFIWIHVAKFNDTGCVSHKGCAVIQFPTGSVSFWADDLHFQQFYSSYRAAWTLLNSINTDPWSNVTHHMAKYSAYLYFTNSKTSLYSAQHWDPAGCPV